MTESTRHRFAFGKNWKNYAATISDFKINEAVAELRRLLQETELEGKNFLDIGSGSGIHSVAAIKLGAKKVTAFDIDEHSVETTQTVLSNYAPPELDVSVQQKDILLATSLEANNSFDVVYSWGVLHHTGNMWKAIENASKFVAPEGKFIIGIYKKTPFCGFWKIEKGIFSRLPALLQLPITSLYALFYLTGLLINGINPVLYIKNYRIRRGMNFWHDMTDWLGGYPYESASPEDIESFMQKLDFRLLQKFNDTPCKAWGIFGSGCAEYVFKRG